MKNAVHMGSVLIPPALVKGDTIGIFAPAGYPEDDSAVHRGIRILHELGFQVKMPSSLWPGADYLADTDQNRGQEFNRLYQDQEVQAMLALRGGFGCLRLLNQIDLAAVAATPKLLVGFSDLTVLHNYLLEKTGLMTLHGPVVTTLHQLDQPSMAGFHDALTGQWNTTIHWRNLEIVRGGAPANGILAGGNLSSLVSMLGTPYEPDWTGKILVLEDIDEPPYRLDRMLTQLALALNFHQVSGILLGDFSLFPQQDHVGTLRHQEMVWNRMLELTRSMSIPIWGGVDVGHGPNNQTLPLGVPVCMHSGQGLLEIRHLS